MRGVRDSDTGLYEEGAHPEVYLPKYHEDFIPHIRKHHSRIYRAPQTLRTSMAKICNQLDLLNGLPTRDSLHSPHFPLPTHKASSWNNAKNDNVVQAVAVDEEPKPAVLERLNSKSSRVVDQRRCSVSRKTLHVPAREPRNRTGVPMQDEGVHLPHVLMPSSRPGGSFAGSWGNKLPNGVRVPTQGCTPRGTCGHRPRPAHLCSSIAGLRGRSYTLPT